MLENYFHFRLNESYDNYGPSSSPVFGTMNTLVPQYSLIPLDAGKWMQTQTSPVMSREYVNVGDIVTGVCIDDDEQKEGHVLKVVLDETPEILYVIVLDNLTAEMVRLDPSTITLVNDFERMTY